MRRAATALGALALAAALVVIGGLAPATLQGVGSPLGNALVLGLGVALGLVAAVQLFLTLGQVVQTEAAPPAPDYEADEVGVAFEDALATLRDPGAAEWERTGADRTLRTTLEPVAVRAVASAHDCSEPAARDHLTAGTWTDDHRAAAFLGGPAPPLPVRVRDWAQGAGSERQARAALAEVARVEGVETEVTAP